MGGRPLVVADQPSYLRDAVLPPFIAATRNRLLKSGYELAAWLLIIASLDQALILHDIEYCRAG